MATTRATTKTSLRLLLYCSILILVIHNLSSSLKPRIVVPFVATQGESSSSASITTSSTASSTASSNSNAHDGSFNKGNSKKKKKEKSFFWEKAENCHAVDNICHAQGNLKQWFYFADGDDVTTTTTTTELLNQPSLELLIEDPGYVDEYTVNNVYFDVSSTSKPPTLFQLRHQKHDNATITKEEETRLLNKCALSPIANHIVLQSVYNGMVGEFYSRSLLPLSNMMLTTVTNNDHYNNDSNHSNQLGSSSSSPPILLSEEEEKQLQFYIHLVENGATTLLDAHKIFLSGMASTQREAKSWSSMFAANIADDDDMPPECECYKRFVLCGYTPQMTQPNEKCQSELEDLDVDDDIIQTLCNAGLDLPTMNRMVAINSTRTLDHYLQHQLKMQIKSQRTEIIQFVKDSSVNVAYHQPASSSTNYLSHHPKYAFDGNMKTRWESMHSDNQYLQVDLGVMHLITRVLIAWNEGAAAKRYDVKVSEDGEVWKSVWSEVDGDEEMGVVDTGFLLGDGGDGDGGDGEEGVTGRYIRMHGYEGATSWGFSIWEMEVIGTPSQSIHDSNNNTTTATLNTDNEWQAAATTATTKPPPPPEKITLIPGGTIHLTDHTECSKNFDPSPSSEYTNCKSYANLRYSLLKHYERNYHHLSQDVHSYRSNLIRNNLRLLRANNNNNNNNNHNNNHTRNHTNSPTNTTARRGNRINHGGWKIIGLTQRIKRRRWLNLNDTISHCNAKFNARRILCVEVNVENLPSSAGTYNHNHNNNNETFSSSSLQPSYEQLLLHQSLDVLIGIHGAQLTQAILLPPHSTVVELLPWAPQNDYFGTGRLVWGDWVQTTDHPTPLGIIYHNTDLVHLGYALGRDSVPLCVNVSNTEMHNFSNDRDDKEEEDDDDDHNEVETELEYCFYEIGKADHDIFRWDNRDFVVEVEMIDGFADAVLIPGNGTSTTITDHDDVQLCDELRRRGEGKNFVLYNVWCKGDDDDVDASDVSLKHYYQEEENQGESVLSPS